MKVHIGIKAKEYHERQEGITKEEYQIMNATNQALPNYLYQNSSEQLTKKMKYQTFISNNYEPMLLP